MISFIGVPVDALRPGAVSITFYGEKTRTGGTVVGISPYFGRQIGPNDFVGRFLVQWPDGSVSHCPADLIRVESKPG